ncbi:MULTISPECIES: hypothetical protein [unclassified Streptomyces]|uniref:hypothetical protein n=1 Tax=unclassified Streptomyces TaxID=2593676 RepID=UPI00386A3AF3
MTGRPLEPTLDFAHRPADLGMPFTLHDTPAHTAQQVARAKAVFEAQGLTAV